MLQFKYSCTCEREGLNSGDGEFYLNKKHNIRHTYEEITLFLFSNTNYEENTSQRKLNKRFAIVILCIRMSKTYEHCIIKLRGKNLLRAFWLIESAAKKIL